ncbi:MAG: 3'-5' exonuclease, partial [Bacteroidota bacterium]
DAALLEQSTALLFAPPDPNGDSRLQLMTVHKAKGLEFDVVIIPRLDGVPRQEEDRLLLWDTSLGEKGLEFLIAPLRERGGEKDPIYSYIKKSRAQKAEYEYVRMLYVAATRAKRRLYFSATLKEISKNGEIVSGSPRPRSFLSYLWPLLEDEIEQRYAEWRSSNDVDRASAEPASGVEIILHRVQAEWTPPRIPPDIHYPAAVRPPSDSRIEPVVSDLMWRAGRAARAAGVVVHAMLNRFAVEGEDFWRDADPKRRDAILHAAFMDAGVLQPEIEILERAAAAVERILQDDRGRWLLATHAQAECEVALTGIDGDTAVSVRIDRTFVSDDGVRWIVDYKTATHEGADLDAFLEGQEKLYRPQLEQYARMMRAWDGRPVRAALYYPLLQRWREVALPEVVN